MARQLGLAVCGMVLWLLFGWQSFGTGQSPPAVEGDSAGFREGVVPPNVPPQPKSGASAGDVIGFSAPSNRGGQLITLVNTSQRWMAVYHIDGSGQIHLVSSRPISQDFAVQYNTTVPLPKEMREIAGR